MDALPSCNIAEENASRDTINFAVSHENRLYTIQDSQRLRVWQLDDALVPTLVATIPLEVEHYAPNFLFTGDRLVLWEDYVISIVDLSANKETFGARVDVIQSCAAHGGALWVQHDDGYGRWDPPADPVVVVPVEDRRGSFGLELEGRIYWTHQDGVDVLDVCGATPKLASKLRLDNVRSVPVLVGGRLAIIENYDDGRNGVVIVDISGPKPKKLAAFFKKQIVRAWAVEGSTLHVIVRGSKKLGGERKFQNMLATVHVDGEPRIGNETELSFVEVYPGGRTQIRWLGLAKSTMAILLGDGTLHRFAR